MNFLKKVSKLLMAGILSTELVLVLDLAAVFFDMRMTPVFFAAALAVASVLSILMILRFIVFLSYSLREARQFQTPAERQCSQCRLPCNPESPRFP